MMNRFNFNDIDVIIDFGIFGTISFGNIATMQINRNNNNTKLLRNNTNTNTITITIP